MIRKMKNKKGFSISEMLMVVLILSLIVVILGGGVVVVKNAYQKITLKSDAQTMLSTTVSIVTDDFRFATDIEKSNLEEIETPTFISENLGLSAPVKYENSNTDGIIYRNPQSTDTNNTQPLLTNKTMASGLIPSIVYSYNSSDNLFTATITIEDSEGHKVIKDTTIKVKPVNVKI